MGKDAPSPLCAVSSDVRLLLNARAKLQLAYVLLAGIHNLSFTREVRELIGLDDPELAQTCQWLLRQMRIIDTATVRPVCLQCGTPLPSPGEPCDLCAGL